MVEKTDKKKKDRREEIIDAAASIFAEKGFQATTVSEIVQKAGIAQGTFYLYFPSKEHLKLALHEQINEMMSAEIINSIQREKDYCKKIEVGIKAAMQVMQDNARLIRAVHLETSTQECEDADRKINLKLTTLLGRLIRDGIAQGVFKETDPDITAFLIVCMCEKATIRALVWEEPVKLELLTPEIITFVKNALIK